MKTNRKKSVAIIGTAGIPAAYGGFETLAQKIIDHTFGQIAYTVFCENKGISKPIRYKNTRLRYLGLNANGLSSIAYDILSMLYSLQTDAILVLGVSGAVFFPVMKLLYRGKIITNIDGIEWQREKWSWLARWFLRLSEYIAVVLSDEVISDNKVIQDYIYNKYKKTSHLIAYGGEETNISRRTGREGNFALALCRIEPENNVDMILKAFSAMPDKNLIFLGNWNQNKYSRKMYRKYSALPNITLGMPIFDKVQLNALRGDSLLYIHGHSAGGTNPSLVESMSVGMAVCAFDVKFNICTTHGECKYFSNEHELRQSILATPQCEWNLIGEKMKKIADSSYQWPEIVMAYEGLFDE